MDASEKTAAIPETAPQEPVAEPSAAKRPRDEEEAPAGEEDSRAAKQARLAERYVGREFLDPDAAAEGARTIVRIESTPTAEGEQWVAVAARDDASEEPYFLNAASGMDAMIDAHEIRAEHLNLGDCGAAAGRRAHRPRRSEVVRTIAFFESSPAGRRRGASVRKMRRHRGASVDAHDAAAAHV